MARRYNAWPWTYHISDPDHFSIEPHIHILCFDVFWGIAGWWDPSWSLPIPGPRWSNRHGPIVMRYQVASNHERLEVRCERVEQKTRWLRSDVWDGYPLVMTNRLTVCKLENGPVEIVEFSHEKWWFSIVFCMFTRPGIRFSVARHAFRFPPSRVIFESWVFHPGIHHIEVKGDPQIQSRVIFENDKMV